MSDVKYIKLSDLIDGEFTVEKVYFPQYKMWDNEARRMLVSERWEKGYRKIYGVVTDKGTLDLSQGQIGGMLESVSKAGESTIIGRTFKVKSNGKSGMDIRYYINPTTEVKEPTTSPSWEAQRERVEARKAEKEEYNSSGLTQEEIDQIPF